MIEATLNQIDQWYNEPTQGGERPKLLSKLAIIELCGWLEGELDNLILLAEKGRLNDSAWVSASVIESNFGFLYEKHFRTMLCRVTGEIFARRIENHLESNHPGEIERLKSILGMLWKARCSFAHADIHANSAAQQTFHAPSWTKNQYIQLEKLIRKLEHSLTQELQCI